jgi:zinc/manganese transport system substrate-binding protein
MAGRATIATLTGAGVAVLLLAGCASTGAGNADDTSGVSVVATTTVWGDIARQIVACADTGEVITLMSIGADPHDFSASSEDVAAMVAADLVVANGLGLEEGLAAALESARSDGANVVELGPLLNPIPVGADRDDHEDGGRKGTQDAHSEDPHVWLDVARVAMAAKLIGDTLVEETGNPRLSECGETLRADLTALDGEMAATLAAVPEDKRLLVTDHDAFGYFAQAYGFTVVGTVVPGGSTLAEPSSRDMATLVETVQDAGVPAIFANLANPTALVEALASEVGDVEVVPLYVGSLGGAGSGADTYQGMMRINAERIAAALAG